MNLDQLKKHFANEYKAAESILPPQGYCHLCGKKETGDEPVTPLWVPEGYCEYGHGKLDSNAPLNLLKDILGE